jgi:hypothetical protein
MSRWEYEALYGGAAGGGKSDALLIEALRQIRIPHYKCLILRKTYPQLAELIDRSRELYKACCPEAKYNGTEHCWTFPSGAKIYFGSMQYTKDRINYQGKRFDLIIFDELTHFTWDEYSYMFSRNRPNGPGTIVYMRAATNPGGIGHGWVKQRFVTPAAPLTTMVQELKIPRPDGGIDKLMKTRIYVPATIYDNKKLMENDPEYIASLALLPEQERKALLEGSWDTFQGQYFMEWSNKPWVEDDNGKQWPNVAFTHVIEPDQIKIQAHWKIYQGFDWGSYAPFSAHWYAVDEQRRIYVFKEFYGCNGVPNKGINMPFDWVGREIRRKENEDPLLRNSQITRIADPAIFKEDGGESMADALTRVGLYFEKADNSRVPGWQQVHKRMAFDEEGIPMLYIFTTCPHLIRTLPELIHDEKDVEDLDSDGEDHAADDLRYVCMANPCPARKIVVPKPIQPFDPLNQRSSKVVYL